MCCKQYRSELTYCDYCDSEDQIMRSIPTFQAKPQETMNSTRNPQYQSKSNVDIVPDTEPQIDTVAEHCITTSTSATAITIPPLLSQSTNSVDDTASSPSHRLGAPVTQPIISTLTDQPLNDAAASDNHESTFNEDKDKQEDFMKMGPSVIYMDVLEKVDSDVPSLPSGSFRINGEYHTHRRYRNPGFCSRQSQQKHQQTNTNAISSEAKGAARSDDNGVALDDVDDGGRRRSGRKRKSAHPAHTDQHTGSKVRDVEVLRPKRGFVIVELPDDAMPGNSFLVSWPMTADEQAYDDSPQFFLFEVPPNVATPTKNKKRLVKVMAPGFYGPPDKKGRSSAERGTPHRTSGIRSFQSPQKAEWHSYKKTTSRVGKLYQVPSLPPVGAKRNDEDYIDAAVEG